MTNIRKYAIFKSTYYRTKDFRNFLTPNFLIHIMFHEKYSNILTGLKLDLFRILLQSKVF